MLLALGALAAIVAALAMPRGESPVAEAAPDRLVATPPTGPLTLPAPEETTPARSKERKPKARRAAARRPARPAPAPVQTPSPAPAPAAPSPLPAADREFGP